MSIEKKTLRSDIPGHNTLMNGNIAYAGSTQEEGRRLVVGRDITLNGAIAACDHLIVEGTVHAQSFSARRMDILEVGFFAGNAEVHDAIIAGRFEGKLSVPGRLTVKSTGCVYGEIEYGTLEVESGARIEGHMTVMTAAAADVPQPVVLEGITTNDNREADDASKDTGGDEGGEDGAEETEKGRPRVFRRAIGF